MPSLLVGCHVRTARRRYGLSHPRGHDEGHCRAHSSTAKGLSSEVAVGPANGLDQDSVISLDNVVTIPASLLGRTIGYLTSEQEVLLARAIVLAYDLDMPLLGG
ncbi:hypothetical protein [Tessaracoccus palaemonis]|uniref:Type II toxin-antitoxin system PemK/MazF family toxin n=1 Tax=Tessaracoccus palaemonis TaxID=2829499 RepID=A0ABX8SPI2_9ACTN|nr:hypothetical protein [Tessaracoccus palaemonis]QXT64018.1 hypothetical protein KDB89_06075 [Tessaracoccus palaemonis]